MARAGWARGLPGGLGPGGAWLTAIYTIVDNDQDESDFGGNCNNNIRGWEGLVIVNLGVWEGGGVKIMIEKELIGPFMY